MKIISVFSLALPLIFTSCKTVKPTIPGGSAQGQLSESASFPLLTDEGVSYYKVKDDLFDRKHMTRISIALIVQSGATKPAIEKLLFKYYHEAAARGGFRYRQHASDIDVSAYASAEHQASDRGQWLSIVYKSPADSAPNLRFDDVQFAQIGVPPVERFGLSDAERHLVFRKLMADKFPENNPIGNFLPADSLIHARHLTQSNLDSITAEGDAKHWPYPPMQLDK